MALAHGKRTVITVNGVDISTAVKNSDFKRGADKHDVTGYGVDDHEFGEDGLFTGEFTMDGTYRTGATGPRGVILPFKGKLVVVTRKPEGTGVGKPLETFTVFVDEYGESSKHTDYTMWATKMTVSGPVAATTQ